MEAALHGVRAAALSQYYGPPGEDRDDPFDAARTHAPSLLRRLLEGAEWQRSAYGVVYNLNFPALPGQDVRGVRATYQGYRAAPTFGVLRHVAPNGRTFLWLTHGHGNADGPAGSDSRECHDGFITVTPLMADLTAHELVAPLAQALG